MRKYTVHDREVVVVLNQSTSFRFFVSDNSSALFIPKTFNLLQLVGVYPWFEGVFNLLIYWVVLCHIMYHELAEQFFTLQCLHLSCTDKKVVWEDDNIFVIVFSLVIIWSSQ